jgi:DNA (cytosine-5)-methyltransferase 1
MFLQPKVFVFENVPGFTSANGGQAYQTVLDDFRNLDAHRREAVEASEPIKVPQAAVNNYEVIFKDVVDATMIGVPQTRRSSGFEAIWYRHVGISLTISAITLTAC